MFNLWEEDKKARKKRRLRDNIRNGKAAESAAKLEDLLDGWQIEDTGRGSDYKAKRYDIFTGEVEEKTVEVKSSPTAPLSDLQKKARKKHKKKGKRYEVKRREPIIW